MSGTIAVVLFPGTNCEDETVRAVQAAGLEARLVRWNERIAQADFAGFVLPGGWSYEDRVRAGAIAAHEHIVEQVAAAAQAGKPVLGICNGAQVLVETGLVPGYAGAPAVALAANSWGYRCLWVHMKLSVQPQRSLFTQAFDADEVVSLPIAHGEGRFTSASAEVLTRLKADKQIPFVYCDAGGAAATAFPVNPNGSVFGAAALCNAAGNVLALMPHPERASWWWQHPPTNRPPWLRAHADRQRSMAPAHGIFRSMAMSIARQRA